MRRFILLAMTGFLLNCNLLEKPRTQRTLFDYYKIEKVDSISVCYFDSIVSRSPFFVRGIKNADTIQKTVDLLRLLPESGEILVDVAVSATLNKIILIESTAKRDTLCVYGGRLQTSNGSFYDPVRTEERLLLHLVIDTTYFSAL